MVKIEEISSKMIRIEIPSEWAGLGREMVFRYCEGIAEAFSLGAKWRATVMTQTQDDTLSVKLGRINA